MKLLYKSSRIRGDFFVYGLLWLVLYIPVSGKSQDSASVTRTQKIVIASQSALYAGSATALALAWYKDKTAGFHLFDDGSEWLQMDKAGHFTTAWQVLRINDYMMDQAGFDKRFSMRWSLISTLGYLTFIEVLDGFSPAYGASVYDFATNIAGAGTYFIQKKTGTEHHFAFKYSFRKSGIAGFRPALLGSNTAEQILKDYNGQTYWLSLNLRSVTGCRSIPPWLNIAAGYGAGGMTGGKNNTALNEAGFAVPPMNRVREYYLSFDIATDQLFKKYKFLNRFFSVFAFIKIPLPGLMFSSGSVPSWKLFSY